MKYLCGRCIHIDTCLVPRSTGCVEECKYFKEMPSHLPKQTNEEWFCSLSTEEKAKFLRKIYRDGRDDYVGEWYEQTEADFVEWLKEIHNE